MREKNKKYLSTFWRKKSIKISNKNLVIKNNHRIFVKSNRKRFMFFEIEL